MFRRAKAIQVRGIPDEKYDALVEAARIEDLPLDKYVLQELEYVARLPRVTQDRTALIRRTQKRIRGQQVAARFWPCSTRVGIVTRETTGAEANRFMNVPRAVS